MKIRIRNFALASVIGTALAAPAYAQAGDSNDSGGLEEIIVTAQKREQSVQDVPIAVTAVTEASLQANRIFSVADLSSVAPGMTVKPSAGGINTPTITMRGQNSYGVVAGSDKQISIYLDGVYLSNPRGSIFDLPDIQRLEVLRGPQGTLFGRNATAGAVSVTTRDPSGETRVKLEAGYGNLDAYRIRGTIETPEIGPFSALFTYVRNYRRGSIKNRAAGMVWDRSLSPSNYGTSTSPLWLGTQDTNSYFAAVKFEPSDTFKLVYKYDRNDDTGTPEGTAIVSYDKSFALGSVLGALYASNNIPFAADALRPDEVSNGFSVPRQQRTQGHSLTGTWLATDNITVKNIFAIRKTNVFAATQLDGVSALTYTQATGNAFAPLAAFGVLGTPTGAFLGINSQLDAINAASNPTFMAAVINPNVGKRLAIYASQATVLAKQYSDELQVNYSSDKLQLTVGGLWFHSKDESGGPIGMQNTLSISATAPLGKVLAANGLLPLGNEGRNFNKATSLAAYAQLEYKVTPEIEFVAGARITHDTKTSQFRFDITTATPPVPTTLIPPQEYSKTKPNFMVGLNWTPNSDILVYGKYSTSFVSGGSNAGLVYDPETASSFELGLKADLFDRKLRANLALFHVDYNHFQSPQGTSAGPSRNIAVTQLTPIYGAVLANQLADVLSTFVVDQGKIRAQGFELELTAAPTRGLTLGTGIGYTDVKYPYINPIVFAANGNRLDVTVRPKWTININATYETEPLFDEATLMFRLDGNYRSSIKYSNNPVLDTYADGGSNAAGVNGTKGFMMVNGRAALRHLKIGGADAELSVWGKNLTNRRDSIGILRLSSYATSANFVEPRTYGIELGIEF